MADFPQVYSVCLEPFALEYRPGGEEKYPHLLLNGKRKRAEGDGVTYQSRNTEGQLSPDGKVWFGVRLNAMHRICFVESGM